MRSLLLFPKNRRLTRPTQASTTSTILNDSQPAHSQSMPSFTSPTKSNGWDLSRAQLAPSQVPAKSRTSPSKPALKPSYSHVVKQGLKTLTRDPGNTHVMKSRAPPVLQVSRVTPRDPGKQESRVTTRDPGKPGDLPRDWSSARPRDVTRFRRATRPLIGTWKTVGQSTVDRRINKVTRLTIVTHAQSAVNAAQH